MIMEAKHLGVPLVERVNRADGAVTQVHISEAAHALAKAEGEVSIEQCVRIAARLWDGERLHTCFSIYSLPRGRS